MRGYVTGLVVRVVILAGFLACAALASGCGRDEAGLVGECVERLVWKGRDYGGLRHQPLLGERLGRTATLGCAGEPLHRVTIFEVRGVSPSIAIAVQPVGRRRYVGLGPGYIVESPRHPLHRAAYGGEDEPDHYADHHCRRPRTLPVRVLTTPVYETKWLRVGAERTADRRYLRGGNVGGILSIDARSELEGLDREGVPYIEAGDRLRAVLRACVAGPEAPPGLRGLNKLIVVRITPR
jgi:hypothetical protein